MASKFLRKYTVPPGFPDILSELTTEILRDQPEDIMSYCMYYFEAKNQVIKDWQNACSLPLSIITLKLIQQENILFEKTNFQSEYEFFSSLYFLLVIIINISTFLFF